MGLWGFIKDRKHPQSICDRKGEGSGGRQILRGALVLSSPLGNPREGAKPWWRQLPPAEGAAGRGDHL